MNKPLLLEKLLHIWHKDGAGKFSGTERTSPMTGKEKWIMFLLLGLLAAVVVLPMEEEESGKSTEDNVFFEHSINSASGEKDRSTVVNTPKTMQEYEAYLSQELADILTQIDGAGQVETWVTVAESEEKIFSMEGSQDTTRLQEADSVGGTRQEETNSREQSVVSDREGEPYVVKTMHPKVEGVLVVAEGAGNSTVKKNISEAVEVLFGIDAHRIKVAKKRVEE